MSTNQRYGSTRVRSMPVPDGTGSGVPLLVGSVPVVTLTAEHGGFATCAFDGQFDLPIETTTAIPAWDPVYITSMNSLTPVSTGNTLFGYVAEAKDTTAGEVHPIEIAQV